MNSKSSQYTVTVSDAHSDSGRRIDSTHGRSLKSARARLSALRVAGWTSACVRLMTQAQIDSHY